MREVEFYIPFISALRDRKTRHGPGEGVLGEAQGDAGEAAEQLADEQPPEAAAHAPAAPAQVANVAAARPAEDVEQPEDGRLRVATSL